MRTSGTSQEGGLILIPVLVGVGLVLLLSGIDLPKTLYGADQAIRGAVSATVDAVKAFF